MKKNHFKKLKQIINPILYKEYIARKKHLFQDISIEIDEYFPKGQTVVWTPEQQNDKNIPNEKVGFYELIEYIPHLEPGTKYEKPIRAKFMLCSSLLGLHIDKMSFKEFLKERKIWKKNKLISPQAGF